MHPKRPQPHVMVRLLVLGVAMMFASGCARLISTMITLPLEAAETVAVETTDFALSAADLTGRLVVDTAAQGVQRTGEALAAVDGG